MSDPKGGSRWWNETSFDYAQNDKEKEYLTVGSEWLGRRILRRFREHDVWATVNKWLPAEKNDGVAFWRVKHADGDDEDLELDELEEAWALAKQEADENHDEIDFAVKEEAEEAKKPGGEAHGVLRDEFVAPKWEEVKIEDEMIRLAWRGIEAAATEDESVTSLGECLHYFTDTGRTAPEPLRGLALYYAEVLAQRCKARLKEHHLPEEPGELCDALLDVYALESAGVNHNELKMHCQEIAKNIRESRGRAAAASAFLGYDPLGLSSKYAKVDAQRSLEDRVKDDLLLLVKKNIYPNELRPITFALLTAFYADRLGLDLLDYGTTGMTTETVLKSSLPLARAAYNRYQTQFDHWLDVLACVAAVLDLASNFGQFNIRTWLVPDEYAFVVRPENIQLAIKHQDLHAVAELARLARLFRSLSIQDQCTHDPLAQAVLDSALPFLLETASEQGSPWQPRAEPELPYARFKANADAARALYHPIRRGFGPALPHIKELFKSLAATSPAAGDALFLASSSNTFNDDKKSTFLTDIDHFAQCAVRLFSDSAIADLKASAYNGAARAPDDFSDDDEYCAGDNEHHTNGKSRAASSRPLRDQAAHRLAGLLKWKAFTDGRIPRFDFGSSSALRAPAAKRRRRMLR